MTNETALDLIMAVLRETAPPVLPSEEKHNDFWEAFKHDTLIHAAANHLSTMMAHLEAERYLAYTFERLDGVNYHLFFVKDTDEIYVHLQD